MGDENVPIWFKSNWEANFARFLEQLRIDGTSVWFEVNSTEEDLDLWERVVRCEAYYEHEKLIFCANQQGSAQETAISCA